MTIVLQPKLLIMLTIILAFSAFLTETKFVPGLANNVGPFEFASMLIIAFTTLYWAKNNLVIWWHPIIRAILVWFILALVSLLNLQSDELLYCMVQLVMILFALLLTLSIYNLFRLNQTYFYYLIRSIVWSTFIVGAWVLLDGFTTGSFNASGPFRNISHMGIYMLTSFWITFTYLFFPNISKFERIIVILALVLALYAILVAGRRSIYISLSVGFIGLSLSFLVLQGSRRYILSTITVVGMFVIAFFYIIGGNVPTLAFFRTQVTTIDDRLALATGTTDVPDEENFVLLQRAGAIEAFLEHPFIGIGWGGFLGSRYSPTGHEMHSTPQRFLAELGIPGVLIYISLIALILGGALKTFFLARQTKYQIPSLVICIGFWSLLFSWLYNRHITERTFWLMLVVYLGMELLIIKESGMVRFVEENVLFMKRVTNRK